MTNLKTIIYLPIVGYRTLRQRAQHLMTLAGQRGIRVFHVNPHVGTETQFYAQATSDANVYEVTLKRPPYPGNRMTHEYALQATMYLQSLIPKGDGKCIIWVNASYWSPIAIPMKNLNNGNLFLVYDILDVFSEFDDLLPYRDWLLQEHRHLLNACDLCTYTAKELLSVYPEIRTTAHLHVPNGINIEDFSKKA